ncbi:MAG: SDR family oxidoreductase [Geminicoccaceae bacterium]|nr:SDR family oxidoreductase [Geminicoccaceae bacterium]
MDSEPLNGVPRRALVTGGGKRIGAAMATALAEDGFDVALHCHRSVDEAEALKAEIEGMGRRAAVLQADLADGDEAAALVPRAAEALGPLGVLVNSAALFDNDRLETMTPDGMERQIAVNLKAPLLLAQAFVGGLPDEASGLVVNLLDQRVLNPTRSYLTYTVAKAGLMAAMEVMARGLAPRVRLAGIGPGHVLSAPGMDDAAFERLVKATPLGIASDVDEIVAAFRFILHARSVTGQMILVDSGMHMGWKYPKR